MDKRPAEIIPIEEPLDSEFDNRAKSGSRTDFSELLDSPRFRAIATIAILALIALLSFFPAASVASDANTYSHTIESLDAKSDNVLRLSAASTATSTAISALPGDLGTPVADKLMDLTGDFALVLIVIFAEKYLLTVLGLGACKVLIPLACLLFAIATFLGNHEELRRGCIQLGAKLAVFSIAALLVVPSSVWVSDKIESTYQDTIDATISQAADATDEASGVADADGDDQASSETTESEDAGILGWIGDKADEAIGGAKDAFDTATSSASDAVESAKQALNNLFEAFAIMMVTSCVIPLLVLFFFIWICNVLLGINLPMPKHGSVAKAGKAALGKAKPHPRSPRI